MLVDIHVHTRPYSHCSVLAREDLLQLATDCGLEALIVCDHDQLWPGAELAAWQRLFGQRGILLLNGAEMASEAGHLLVFGAQELPRHTRDPRTILDHVHAQGGVTVLAHPFRHGRLTDLAAAELAALFRPFDGIEVLNGNLTAQELQRGLRAYAELGFTALGGSDAHSAAMVARFLTETPPLSDINDFLRAVRMGDVRPVVGPPPLSRSEAIRPAAVRSRPRARRRRY